MAADVARTCFICRACHGFSFLPPLTTTSRLMTNDAIMSRLKENWQSVQDEVREEFVGLALIALDRDEIVAEAFEPVECQRSEPAVVPRPCIHQGITVSSRLAALETVFLEGKRACSSVG